MRTLLILIVAGLIAGCGKQPARSGDEQLNEGPLEESLIRDIRREYPGMTDACAAKVRAGGLKAWPEELQECFAMTPLQRWKGLWRNDFEGMRFCPAPSRECSYETPGDIIWPTFPEGSRYAKSAGSGALYAIEFLGRRTVDRGRFGHMGMSDHEMIVDRVLAMKEVESPRPPPSEAELVAYWKECQAAKTCVPSDAMKERIKRSE